MHSDKERKLSLFRQEGAVELLWPALGGELRMGGTKQKFSKRKRSPREDDTGRLITRKREDPRTRKSSDCQRNPQLRLGLCCGGLAWGLVRVSGEGSSGESQIGATRPQGGKKTKS